MTPADAKRFIREHTANAQEINRFVKVIEAVLNWVDLKEIR